MTKKKILILIVALLFMATLTSVSLLYFVTPRLLANAVGLGAISKLTNWHFTFQIIKSKNEAKSSVGIIFLVISIIIPFLIFGGIGLTLLIPQKRKLHGNARFANDFELKKSGLLEPDKPDDKFPSVIVGKRNGKYLLFRGMQFLFLAAPTRSGKGVGIVIPNLLHYRDSVVVLDIKDENFEKTAGFRASCGQAVYRFAPGDETSRTDCWNPLDYVRDDPDLRLTDLQKIAAILYPMGGNDEVWVQTAQGLFIGLALFCMDTNEPLNLAHIKKLPTTLACLKDEETFIKYVEQSKSLMPLSADCIFFLRNYAQTTDKMRISVLISFNTPLGVFSDTITARATSKSTFDLRDVRKKRMSIYVSITPDNLSRYGKLLNLFFTQLLQLNMQELPEKNPNLKYQCLLLLDEFPAIGKMRIISDASAFMAGYNMRLLLIFQSRSQLEDKALYDIAGTRTMLTNMALQILYAPREQEEAENYSKMLGFYTEKSKSRSKNIGTGKTGGSESVSDQKRALLNPDEIKDIGQHKAIVTLENCKPAFVDKIIYYKDPAFLARVGLPLPTIPSQAPLNSIEPTPESITEVFSSAAKLQPLAVCQFEVGFSPNRNALEVIISGILSAKNEILVASYSLTSEVISKALTEAKERGVDVQVVIDAEQNNANHGFDCVSYLKKNNIKIFINSNYQAMHHKFMVFDNRHLQFGSFNYTFSASHKNAEVAVMLHDVPVLAEIFKKEWIKMAHEPKVNKDLLAKLHQNFKSS